MREHQPRTSTTPLTPTDRVAVHTVPAVLAAVGACMAGADTDRVSRTFGVGQRESSAKLFRRVAGLRTTWLGLAVVTLYRAGQYRALGWLLLIMGLNPAADLALAAAAGGGRRSLVHLPGTLATIIVGARLLRLTQPPSRTP